MRLLAGEPVTLALLLRFQWPGTYSSMIGRLSPVPLFLNAIHYLLAEVTGGRRYLINPNVLPWLVVSILGVTMGRCDSCRVDTLRTTAVVVVGVTNWGLLTEGATAGRVSLTQASQEFWLHWLQPPFVDEAHPPISAFFRALWQSEQVHPRSQQEPSLTRCLTSAISCLIEFQMPLRVGSAFSVIGFQQM